MSHRSRPARTLAAVVLAALPAAAALTGCAAGRSVKYGFWEKFGYEKRDLLVDQVQDARAEQEDTREAFTSALEQFKATFGFDGGQLQKAYDGLKASYDRCAAQADDLRGEIRKVKTVAGDLFKEWAGEIEMQQDATYKQVMQQQLDDTKRAYEQMVGKMDDAAAKMAPVLTEFNNRVLLLKSTLNAQAIASLEARTEELVGNIEELIASMNASIAEADAFIAAVGADHG